MVEEEESSCVPAAAIRLKESIKKGWGKSLNGLRGRIHFTSNERPPIEQKSPYFRRLRRVDVSESLGSSRTGKGREGKA